MIGHSSAPGERALFYAQKGALSMSLTGLRLFVFCLSLLGGATVTYGRPPEPSAHSKGIDHRPLLPPVHDQNNTGLCASFAVSDALTVAHRGQKVSPMSVMARYHQHRGGWKAYFSNLQRMLSQKHFYGAPVEDVLDVVSRTKVCSTGGTGSPVDLRQEDFHEAYDSWQTFRSYFGPKFPEDLYWNFESAIDKIFPRWEMRPEAYRSHKTLEALMGEWLDSSCSLQPLNGFKMRTLNFAQGVSRDRRGEVVLLAEELTRILKMGQLPLIGYRPAFLRARMDRNANHASSIVGCRERKGFREFLLRNTWGADCRVYDSQWARRCESGHIWVDEKTLAEAVYLVTWLQKAPGSVSTR